MKKNRIIILILFSLVISFHFNFFQNFYDVYNLEYKERMIRTYGNQDNQGYGFIKEINNRYKLVDNFIYYNFDKAEPHWLINQKPIYVKNLNEVENLKSVKDLDYLIIIDETSNELIEFMNLNRYEIIFKDKNSYLISIL